MDSSEVEITQTTPQANFSNQFPSLNKTSEVYNKLLAVPFIIFVYAVFLIFVVVGNCAVCWIVIVNSRMHNVTNYLLINLALSDLLFGLSTTLHMADFIVKNLDIGNVGCKFQVNMVNIPYGSSVLTLTFIACERYFAICKPIYHLGVKDRAKWFIPAVWVASFTIYSPTIYFCGKTNTADNQLSCDCTKNWPSLRAKNAYGIFIVVMLYVVPLCTVVGCYSNVIRRVRQAPPGEEQNNMSAHRSRKGVVKMVLITLVVFFVSWTPYNILYFLKRIEVDYRRVYAYVWYPSLLLVVFHCACNPIIYCLMGRNFREGFKSAWSGCLNFTTEFFQALLTHVRRFCSRRRINVVV